MTVAPPDPRSFPEIDPKLAARLAEVFDDTAYHRLLGLVIEEVRLEYARVLLPYSGEIEQPRGAVHGGALASAIDTAAALATFSGLGKKPKRIATIDMHLHFMQAVRGEDVIVEAVVRRRGQSVVFSSVEARTTSGKVAAHGEVSFFVEV